MLLKNKTAVITGCSRGIGIEILKTFSKNGADIFACVRNIDDKFILLIDEIKKQYKNKIIPLEIDLSDQEKVKNCAKRILESNEPVDILVNNAGTITTSLFQMTSSNKLKELFEINFFSQSTFTQYLVKSMIKNKKGNIINISSSSAIDGDQGRSAYAASKAALITQSKVLSRELGKHNIRVNIVAPGLTETEMMTQNHSKDLIDETIKKISLNRTGKPAEIANVVLFLSCNLSSYITGQVLRVDGGM
jgi:3-oxoacyl-[acyl-carrier protein] reductase